MIEFYSTKHNNYSKIRRRSPASRAFAISRSFGKPYSHTSLHGHIIHGYEKLPGRPYWWPQPGAGLAGGCCSGLSLAVPRWRMRARRGRWRRWRPTRHKELAPNPQLGTPGEPKKRQKSPQPRKARLPSGRIPRGEAYVRLNWLNEPSLDRSFNAVRPSCRLSDALAPGRRGRQVRGFGDNVLTIQAVGGTRGLTDVVARTHPFRWGFRSGIQMWVNLSILRNFGSSHICTLAPGLELPQRWR